MLTISGAGRQAAHWHPNMDLPALSLAVPPNPYTGDASYAAWVFAPSQAGGNNIYEAHCNFYADNGGTGDYDWNQLDELPDALGPRQLVFSDNGAWILRTQPGTAADWASSIPRAAADIKYWHGLRINDSINVYHNPQEIHLNASGYGYFGSGGYSAYPATPNFYTTVISRPTPFIFTPLLLAQNALAALLPTDSTLLITGVCARWVVPQTVDAYRSDWSSYTIPSGAIACR